MSLSANVSHIVTDNPPCPLLSLLYPCLPEVGDILFSLRYLRACLSAFTVLILDLGGLAFCKMTTILFKSLLASSSSIWPFSCASC